MRRKKTTETSTSLAICPSAGRAMLTAIDRNPSHGGARDSWIRK